MRNCRTIITFVKQYKSPSLEIILEKLEKSSLKVTSTRKALLAVFSEFSEPVTTDQVIQKVQEHEIPIHRATVYRDLTALVQEGLLRELAIRGSLAHYYEFADNQHYHFVCQHCHRISVISPLKVEKAIATFNKSLVKKGYTVSSNAFKVYGLCPNCTKKVGFS